MKKVNDHTHVADTGYPCPSCGHHLDAASHPSGEAPGPGDFSICSECVSILCFEDPMPKTRIATDEDLGRLDPRDREAMLKIQKTFREIKERDKADKAASSIFMKHFGGE